MLAMRKKKRFFHRMNGGKRRYYYLRGKKRGGTTREGKRETGKSFPHAHINPRRGGGKKKKRGGDFLFSGRETQELRKEGTPSISWGKRGGKNYFLETTNVTVKKKEKKIRLRLLCWVGGGERGRVYLVGTITQKKRDRERGARKGKKSRLALAEGKEEKNLYGKEGEHLRKKGWREPLPLFRGEKEEERVLQSIYRKKRGMKRDRIKGKKGKTFLYQGELWGKKEKPLVLLCEEKESILPAQRSKKKGKMYPK